MALFPVIEAEIATAEAALGIKLPPVWKERMLDSRMKAILGHHRVDGLRPNHTMMQFVALSHAFRERFPDAPRDAVVMQAGVARDGTPVLGGGYTRFWLPDRKQPSRLGEMVHVWNPERRRVSKDCLSGTLLDTYLSCVPAELSAALGLETPTLPEAAPLIRRARPWSAEVTTALSPSTVQSPGATDVSRERWLPACEFDMKGAYLEVADQGVGLAPAATRTLRTGPGRYDVEVLVASGGDASGRVRGLRITKRRCSVESERLALVVSVDMAAIAVFDRQALLRQVPVEDRDGLVDELMGIDDPTGVYVAGRNAEFLLCPSGAGDGAYEVFALHDKSGPVGLRMSFAGNGVRAR